MRRLCSIIYLLSLGWVSQAQVTGGEYFFDNDPGVGNATAISLTAGNTVNHSFTAPIAGLSQGLHNLFVRVKNAQNTWSHSAGRLLYILAAPSATTSEVVSGEWFIDTDPGIGNGTAISFASSQSVNHAITVATTGLTPGLHNLFVRVKNSEGTWSHYEGRMFYILENPASENEQVVTGEWFIDTDPGIGNGTAISFASSQSVNHAITVATTGLTPGLHNLFVRVKNSEGTWSHYEGRMFYILENPASENEQVVTGEWFIDTDPGIGNGTAISFASSQSVNPTIVVPLSSLSLGLHNLFVRVRKSDGTWSHYEGREFEVSDVVLSTVSGTITYDNNASTPMSNVTVELLDAQNAVVATATTDASGSYSFSDVADGSYTVRPSTTKAWGGVSSIDITLYKRHIGNVPGFILQGIRLGSGDVNLSTTLTSIDLTIIKRRIGAQISSFASGDWLFEDGSITVSGGNVSRNIKAICYGDANGSYIPPQ